jgi:hypothetical protein
MLQTGRQPDIIHCHDWSTALVSKFLWSDYHHNGLWKPRCAFTIHNLEFGQAKVTSPSPPQLLRIGRVGFGTGRQRRALERGTTPTRSRRTCSPRYGLHSCFRGIGRGGGTAA